MKNIVNALMAIAIAASPALSATIFEDLFDTYSLSDYTQACYLDPSWPGSAVWQVSNGVLRGQSLGGTVCYAGVGDPSWEISSVRIRMKGVIGCDKGINIVNSAANTGVAVNLRSGHPAAGNGAGDIMVSYHGPHFDTLSLPHSNGEWMDVEIRIVGTDMLVYINGAHLTTVAIYDSATVLPLNEIRPWVYTGGAGPSTVDYDDIIVEGNGVVAVDATSWGALKATYR